MPVPSGEAAPRLSVVVPSRGPAARLRATLSCLAGQGPGTPPFEVLVVDDNPGPVGEEAGTPAAVAGELARELPVRLVPGPLRGRAAARNAGAAAARGARLVFLDDDVLVGPDFLAAHAEAADPDAFTHGRTRELPTAARLLRSLAGASPEGVRRARAALGPAPAPAPAPAGPAAHRRLVANALERTVEAMAGGTLPDVAPWLGFVGANTAVDRGRWRRAGGFDEGFGHTWGCEDLEFGFRLHAAGVRRSLAADALGVHLSHARPGRWEQHHRNLTRFRALHPCASVHALEALLGPGGTPGEYVRAVAAAAEAPVRGGAR
ncbi:glycosyltransferase [Streptomyces sp. VNUA116]|uniref:glycosyltransferase family 2 protein n=1 Tax=Streptomyces sp. VNUA116 TaxID=3062449 RepID=UPI002674C636|nr:glycosyltransferase [Streptomyces sp. VNUA116]WKU48912.1 glycosyltransferase [Streptomyces sp. VNUA116]